MIFRFIKEQRYFFIPYFLFIAVGLVLSLNEDKIDLHLYLISINSEVADFIFFWLTKVAEGWFGAPLLIALLFYNYRSFLFVGLTYLFSAAITQLLKNFVFQDHWRPLHYLYNHPAFRRVEGVEISEYHSFPSGHSTSAFALFFCLSLLAKNHYVKVLAALCAIAVAYSRVYLSQHFLQDIIGGSFVGISVGFIFYYFMYERKILFKSEKLNKRLKF